MKRHQISSLFCRRIVERLFVIIKTDNNEKIYGYTVPDPVDHTIEFM